MPDVQKLEHVIADVVRVSGWDSHAEYLAQTLAVFVVEESAIKIEIRDDVRYVVVFLPEGPGVGDDGGQKASGSAIGSYAACTATSVDLGCRHSTDANNSAARAAGTWDRTIVRRPTGQTTSLPEGGA